MVKWNCLCKYRPQEICSIARVFLACRCKSTILYENYWVYLTTFIFGWNRWRDEQRSLALKLYPWITVIFWGKIRAIVSLTSPATKLLSIQFHFVDKYLNILSSLIILSLFSNFQGQFCYTVETRIFCCTVWNVFKGQGHAMYGTPVFYFHFVINSAGFRKKKALSYLALCSHKAGNSFIVIFFFAG